MTNMAYKHIFLPILNKIQHLKNIQNPNNWRKASNNLKSDMFDRFKVHIIPALNDNFMYLCTDKVSRSAFAIDPVEPDKVFEVIKQEKVTLKAILTTHHHLDHSGGNDIIAERIKNITIYGGDDRINAINRKLSHLEIFKVESLTLKCLHTPCHTSGHVCYYAEAGNLGSICFTGDTLFISGCGRFFEGTAAHMLNSLNILSSLPPDTLIYCGHEYTVNNLKFALSVEPDNEFAIKKLKSVEEKIKRGEPSVPSTIKEELSYNPFMRTDKKSVQMYTGETNPVLVMKALREKKTHSSKCDCKILIFN